MGSRILNALMARLIFALVLLSIGGIASLFSGPHHASSSSRYGSGASGDGSSNPWSKDYVAPEPTSGPTASGSAYVQTRISDIRSRYEASQSDDDRRDEAFRRQKLREWREAEEARNGPSPQP